MKANKFISQFGNLKSDDPGTWPIIPRLVVMMGVYVGVLAAGFLLHTSGQLSELEEGRSQEEALEQTYQEKHAKAVNIDLYKRQLVEVDEAFGSMLRQLPDKANMESLITDINQSGINKGLMFDLFKPAASEEKKDFYAIQPIAISVTGTYHQMGEFASEIAKLPRIVTLNDMSITVGKNGRLQIDVTAKTFRYLDDEELAEQRRANAKKTPPAGA